MNQNSTLDEIEGVVWAPTPEWDSDVAETVRTIRTKPLGELTPDDLCIMMDLNISRPVVVPMALDVLAEEGPFVDNEPHEGGLLGAVVCVEETFWECNSAIRSRAIDIVKQMVSGSDNRLPDEPSGALPSLRGAAVRRFLKTYTA